MGWPVRRSEGAEASRSILAADVVGFSARWARTRKAPSRGSKPSAVVIEPKVSDHQGRLVKTTGDGFLVEFSSPVEAVRCAVKFRRLSRGSRPWHPPALQLRIGINLGDIIIEGDGDIYGDGVNVAARLEQMAEPGGICVSGKVYDEVRDKLAYSFEDQGEQQVKNMHEP